MSLQIEKKLLGGGDVEAKEQQGLIELLHKEKPDRVLSLFQVLLNQRRRLQAELETARQARSKAETELAKLRSPPWIPGTVLRVTREGRADVLAGGRRQVVSSVAEIEAGTLRSGDAVFLDRELSLLVGRDPEAEHTGSIGVVSESVNGKVVIRGIADEEIACSCDPTLAATLRPGHRVVYNHEIPFIIDQLPDRSDSRHVLEEIPDVRFQDIGGLDEQIFRIRRDLDLHLLAPPQVAPFRLRMLRGVTLVGPPGVGKTMVAKGIARHLAEGGTQARFFHVRPGALRSMWYGDTERRIRDLFSALHASAGMSVVFFDEIDSFGRRGTGSGQDIDARVMGALLTEIDGMESRRNTLIVGATNRLDLCDKALVREGRLGDRIYRIPRPGREAARAVLRRYLTPDLPYASEGGGGEPDRMIDIVVSRLYAPNAPPIATATLANGAQRTIRARDVLSGALLTSAVESAKHAAAHRSLQDGGGGIAVDDLIEALEESLEAEGRQLRAPHVARQVLEIPEAEEIVRVELPSSGRPRRHRYVRAA